MSDNTPAIEIMDTVLLKECRSKTIRKTLEEFETEIRNKHPYWKIESMHGGIVPDWKIYEQFKKKYPQDKICLIRGLCSGSRVKFYFMIQPMENLISSRDIYNNNTAWGNMKMYELNRRGDEI